MLSIIYDFGDEFINLGPLTLSLILFFGGKFFRKRYPFSKVVSGRLLIVISYFTFAVFLLRDLTYIQIRNAYHTKRYKTVEGVVENYIPITPSTGYAHERFTVKGVFFHYANNDYSYGYDCAASNGGVIKANLSVKINYIHNGEKNLILVLEVKNK